MAIMRVAIKSVLICFCANSSAAFVDALAKPNFFP